MAGTPIEGKNCKVTLGSNSVLGIGNWKYTPGAADQLDDTEFGDKGAKIKLGIHQLGSISFDGLARIGDTTGQEALKLAKVNGTDITNLRFYESDTTYLEANHTAGYFSASSTTGNDTQVSYINITSYDLSSEMKSLGKISFSGTVSGEMVEN